jgi:hypothetical protein
MIIKGKSRGNGAQLGRYLATRGKNEDVRVFDMRGVASQDVAGAVREMDALGAGARTEKPLYHASINTPARERLTDEQITYAVEKLEKALGLEGQPHVVMVHVKNGRQHIHVVISRIDLERNAAISDSNNYAKHEAVARKLEWEFALTQVQGAHVDREGKPRPKRTPSQDETLQAERTGVSIEHVKQDVTALWRGTRSGSEFADALWQAGYLLARGDRRDYVIIDQEGGTHSLARRIEGARAKDVRERMADLRPDWFPSVPEAKAIQRARQEDALRQEEEMKKRSGRADDLTWTHHGGMVEQQHSANMWMQKSLDEKRERSSGLEERKTIDEADELRKQVRQAFLRQFGKEVEGEWTRESGQDLGRQRSR